MTQLRAIALWGLLITAAWVSVSAQPVAEKLSTGTLQLAQLSPTNGTNGDEFGTSVAISEDTVVVGASNASDESDGKMGAAFVFVSGDNGWMSMKQTAKLTAVSNGRVIKSGYWVAIDGDTIVVAGYDSTILQDALFVFVKPPGGWVDMPQTAELTATGVIFQEGFTSVGISGDTIVGGEGLNNVGSNFQQGEAYVFVKPVGGWTNMTQTATLTASDAQSSADFGWSVGISGDTVVAGAPNAGTHAGLGGEAYVFVKPATGWADMTETAILSASDSAFDDGFGDSAGIAGSTLVVGAPNANVGQHNLQGAAYVFVEPPGGWTNMSETAKLTASDLKGSNHFGWSVATNGQVAVAGTPNLKIGANKAQGAAYVFVKPANGWSTTSSFQSKLTVGTAGSNFGASVAAAGTTVVAGAPTGVFGGNNKKRGLAYVIAR